MLTQKRTYEKRPNAIVLIVYANDGHIESRRTFKRLSSEEAKEVKSGYDWDYEYALKLGTASGGATAFSYGIGTKELIMELLGQLQ